MSNSIRFLFRPHNRKSFHLFKVMQLASQRRDIDLLAVEKASRESKARFIISSMHNLSIYGYWRKKKEKEEEEEEEEKRSLTLYVPLFFSSLFTRYPSTLEEAEGFFLFRCPIILSNTDADKSRDRRREKVGYTRRIAGRKWAEC